MRADDEGRGNGDGRADETVFSRQTSQAAEPSRKSRFDSVGVAGHFFLEPHGGAEGGTSVSDLGGGDERTRTTGHMPTRLDDHRSGDQSRWLTHTPYSIFSCCRWCYWVRAPVVTALPTRTLGMSVSPTRALSLARSRLCR